MYGFNNLTFTLQTSKVTVTAETTTEATTEATTAATTEATTEAIVTVVTDPVQVIIHKNSHDH